MSALEGPVVYVDIETNGLNHIRGRIIEVAVIRVEDGVITQSFNQLIDPETNLPQFISSLTGITDADVRSAPTFHQIADELYEIMAGAVFVAHNVRFDYSFLKQEFKRVGREFCPKQLCTVKLSRTLYPQYKSHKLEQLIARHGFTFTHRHRAYDDAHVLWQFMQRAQAEFTPEVFAAAIAKQIHRPALPKELPLELINNLPNTNGIYIFEDELGKPLYIGKSINIKKRVLSHFTRDHAEIGEFKIAQQIRNISVQETASELEALLLESELIKEMQPLYNKRLRRTQKLAVVKYRTDDDGYYTVFCEDVKEIDPDDLANILAVYPRRGRMKESLETIAKTFDLCPKLLGLEKAKTSCFSHQLKKCRGACVGKESYEIYNQRLHIAFQNVRLQEWPYASPIIISAKDTATSGVIVDQWCVIGKIKQEEYCEPVIKMASRVFDFDTYKILQSHLATKINKLVVRPISLDQLNFALPY